MGMENTVWAPRKSDQHCRVAGDAEYPGYDAHKTLSLLIEPLNLNLTLPFYSHLTPQLSCHWSRIYMCHWSIEETVTEIW